LCPALVCLACIGWIDADRVVSIQQEHMPIGEHRNFTMPFPDWVPTTPVRQPPPYMGPTSQAQLGSVVLNPGA
jgi:hypothetical protein